MDFNPDLKCFYLIMYTDIMMVEQWTVSTNPFQ